MREKKGDTTIEHKIRLQSWRADHTDMPEVVDKAFAAAAAAKEHELAGNVQLAVQEYNVAIGELRKALANTVDDAAFMTNEMATIQEQILEFESCRYRLLESERTKDEREHEKVRKFAHTLSEFLSSEERYNKGVNVMRRTPCESMFTSMQKSARK